MTAREQYQSDRIAHWDALARQSDRWRGLGGYYHRRLQRVYSHLVTPGARVLEIGCGQGDLLAAVRPACGVGVDFSGEMIARARRRHPDLHFAEADAHDLPPEETFDAIILSDLVNELWDVQAVLEQARRLSHPRTRLILNFYSRLWELPLRLARACRLAQAMRPQNWLTVEDTFGLLNLAGFEPIRHWNEIIWPVCTPLVDAFFNRFVVKLWPLRHLGLVNMVVARPAGQPASGTPAPKVSIVVPARNEAGHIPAILDRLPPMGEDAEVIFVEGGSTDDTYQAIERAIADHPQHRCKLIRQPGKGKGDAVRAAFAIATGDALAILDADVTVAPEDMPRFFQALASGKAEFVNGVRLLYPMQAKAMRFLNLAGNKFFSMAFSWLLGQPIKDTLCGTKVLWRSDYERIAANRAYFGEFDPFGDFDLIFGAARLSLKIVDLPVRYAARTYGTTNISRFSQGWLLLRMLAFAARKLKFT